MIIKYTSEKVPGILDNITQVNDISKINKKIRSKKIRVSWRKSWKNRGLNDQDKKYEKEAVELSRKLYEVTQDVSEKCTYANIFKGIGANEEAEKITKKEFIDNFSKTPDNTIYLIKDEEIKGEKLEIESENIDFFDFDNIKYKKYIGVVVKNVVLDNTVFELEAISNSLFSGLTVKGNEGGINLPHSNLNTIVNNKITGCGWGLSLPFSFKNTVLKNKIIEAEQVGISFLTGNTVADNEVYKTKNIGIEIGGTSNIIIKNKCKENKTGIELARQHNLIINNEIESNEKNGIVISGSKGIEANNTLLKNEINSNEVGIGIKKSDNNIIKNNNFSKNKTGIFNKSSDYIIFLKNKIFSHKNGIHQIKDCRGTIIKENFFENNACGIFLHGGVPWGHYTHIIKNGLYENKEYGVYIHHQTSVNFEENIFQKSKINTFFSDSFVKVNPKRKNICLKNERNKVTVRSELSLNANLNLFLDLDENLESKELKPKQKEEILKILFEAKIKKELKNMLEEIKEKAGVDTE